jgi:coenzyme F420-0:L-glutamate ligase/coenzyme F420-1:gamma-L-glutamate ligase
VTGGARIEVLAPDGVPEVVEGDDLVDLLLRVCEPVDGDVVLVTSKVVSKAEGKVRHGDRDEALAGETVRVVARRGPTTIVRNRLGLTMAAAGIDASNVPAGRIVLLPDDPDASARRLREGVRERTGRNVGVVVTDTAGRAWREGQTDIAIGAAGMVVAESFAGRLDAHGNELAVTQPAVADELAGAAELAQGKLGGRPFAVVRGRADLVLPAGDHGPGAAALVRREGGDLFGYGAREAVVRALAGDPAGQAPFGAPAAPAELVAALVETSGGTAVLPTEAPPDPSEATGAREEEHVVHLAASAVPRVVSAVCFAHGWRLLSFDRTAQGVVARVSPATP